MNEDNEVDISDVMRQRTSREEVRRRNREIMERANAELRESKSGAGDLGKSPSGKEYSRFSLIKQSREGSQTFWVPYRFHTSHPELVFGPLKFDVEVDPSRFSDFNRDSVRPLFTDCLKSTCLVDPTCFTFMDLVNPEESFQNPSAIDPADEALLTNDLTHVQSEVTQSDGIYTGHFLRKPQLMSNDLFTEGNRNVGSLVSKFTIPQGSNQAENADFEAAKSLDQSVRDSGKAMNPSSKRTMKVKRLLRVLPDSSGAKLVQFKFDDRSVESGVLGSVLSSNLELFENESMQLDGSSVPDLPCTYAKRRRYMQTNKGSQSVGSDEFYLLTIPDDSRDQALLKPLGSKCMVKKATSAQTNDSRLKLIPR
jgi:hypothetical protein